MTTTLVTPPQTLLGKVALVSGSSSGIGAAIAWELSRRGAHVVINYPFETDRQRAEEVLNGLQGKAKSIIVEADLSTLGGPRSLVVAVVAEFGKIDILVNNAGISALSVLNGPDDEEIEKVWDSVVRVNGRGTLVLTRESLKYLSSSQSRIINI